MGADAVNSSFTWYFWPQHRLFSVLKDEFLTGRCRLRIDVETITVETDESESVAFQAARDYLAAVQRHLGITTGLITPEDFFARGGKTLLMSAASPTERRRTRPVTAKLREELAASDAALRRSYRYLQLAQDGDEIHILPTVYKAVETIENVFGGEKAAGNALGVLSEIKAVKRMANEDSNDQRHPPSDPSGTVEPVDPGEGLKLARRIVTAYEDYLLSA
jgi:hypothetical protein